MRIQTLLYLTYEEHAAAFLFSNASIQTQLLREHGVNAR